MLDSAFKMRRLIYIAVLFFFLFLVHPCNAYEGYQLPDTDGIAETDVYNPIIGNDKWQLGYSWNIVSDWLSSIWEPAGSLNNSYDPDFIVYSDSEFFCDPSDRITQFRLELTIPDEDPNNYTIPVRFTSSNESRVNEYYVKVWHTNNNYNWIDYLDILDSDMNVISSQIVYSGTNVFVKFSDNSVYVNKMGGFTSWNDFLWGNDRETSGNETALNFSFYDQAYFDISGYNEAGIAYIKIIDGYEYTKSYNSLPMAIYWMITKVIPDNNNVLYNYFQAIDTGFSLLTVFVGVLVAMPFAYVFFAGVCGLCVCVLKGSFSAGFPAGVRTFINILVIPVNALKTFFHLLMKLIEAIKPI